MSYIIGNLVGRFLMSAFLVWLVLLLMSRFNLSQSFKKMRRPLPIIATILLFILALAGNAVAETHPPHERQFFSVTTFPEIGVDQIYIPSEPHWQFETQIKKQSKTIRLIPDQNTKIAALVELSQHAFIVPDSRYHSVRNSITENIGKSLNSELMPVTGANNHLNAFSYEGTSAIGDLRFRHQLDIFKINHRIWTFHTFVTEQSDDPFQVFRAKIFRSIRLSNSQNNSKG